MASAPKRCDVVCFRRPTCMDQYFFSPQVLQKRKLSTPQLPNLSEYAVNLRRKRPHTLDNNSQAQEMNVIYIRSYPSPPHDPEPTSATASSHGKDVPATRKRQWRVSIRVNNNAPTLANIEDPFPEVDYSGVFEKYLQSSGRPRWSSQNLAPDQDGLDDIALAEKRIEEYGKALFDQLDKNTNFFETGDSEAQIYVVEHHGNDNMSTTEGGIHCLAWELLESVEVARLPNLRLRVTRVSDFPSRRSIQPPRPEGPRLAEIQADTNATFKILLVIARDFSRAGAQRDPEPDLAQWPLMNLQKKLRSRLTLEIVRPGSLEELDRHLSKRAKQKVEFNLVHFDLHGRLMRNETGELSPWLMFAKQYRPSASESSIPQTQLAKADAVAEVLAQHQVENVVLNACLSAYNRSGPATNLTHIFLRHGISNVSAMWYYVHWKTVQTYVEAFYDKLLIECLDFHAAAQRARESLRQQPTCLTGRAYQDFFLCVNYARNSHRSDSMLREASPSPSVKSHDSTLTTSNASIKSSRSGSWMKPSSRITGGFGWMNGPILRLQLHLLELEYKLMTFRIVYASDLDQAGSDLDGTLDRMVNMWLNTNLIDEVLYYKAKDFGKRSLISGGVSVTRRDRRRRGSYSGPLQRLFPRAVDPVRQTLHIVREVDSVVDPGMQADELENQRQEERRFLAQEGLKHFANKVHEEGCDYMIFLGSQNAQWWRTYLQALDGEWWLGMPWSFTVHTRFSKATETGSKMDQHRPCAPTGLAVG
ncbi:TPR repeat-containing protein [Metarhizium album ARSEF 1941]|uniref:TPR repeat-containing protein n=1 Tax=Metarhizium album (strain ARSEF 1941) TaxID=1081103 RepID=A0A0B2WME3_METAS|nr:TPR repeat-containing protein [Metarhizium album ARSEF 1941]KHN97216.1 TPR repeat-containing protein [Metarhizium album ARSEF 1941]